MKMHIKLPFLILFFFATITYSNAQTTDSLQQDGNAVETEQSQETNSPGDMNISGDRKSASTSGTTGSETPPENTDNEYLNAIINNNNNNASQPAERVKGTRAPNEYSSGRSGGQYNIIRPASISKPTSSSSTNANDNAVTGNTGGAGQADNED